MAKVKILVVGDPGSIHTARFASLLQEMGHDIRIFQSENYYIQDEHLKNITIYVDTITQPPLNNNTLVSFYPLKHSSNNLIMDLINKFIHFTLSITNRIHIPNRNRINALKWVIKDWDPDIVFSLKMQNDGYTVNQVKQQMKQGFKPKWIHFNWGTDIEFFAKHPRYKDEHLPKIKQVLSLCDYFVADCQRDVDQAKKYGLKGINLGKQLANGGFDLKEISKIPRLPINKRKTILIKGREWNDIGRAFTILKALDQIPHELKDYKIKVILATENVKSVCSFLNETKGINFQIMDKIPYTELLKIFGESRIAISSTHVDGTPSFLIEAMLMGAFPIHSDISSIREWIDDGKNGLLFPVENFKSLKKQILKALIDDELIIRAQIINQNIVMQKMDRKQIKQEWQSTIRNIINK